jgi:hypothetical protein
VTTKVLLGFTAALLAGCALQQPNTLSLVDRANAARLQADYSDEAKLRQAIEAADNNNVQRNILLNDLILVVDLNYYRWEKRLYDKKAVFDLGTDATLLGLGGATALAGATATANILGQITTGITGLKSSVDTDVLQKNSIPALVSKMRAGRATQLAKIQAAMTATDDNGKPVGPSSISKYSIRQGLIDITAYHAAGTFVGALQDITAKAAEEKQQADTKINTLKPNSKLINKTPPAPGA